MNQVSAFLQLSNRQVWLQAVGRFLYQAGYGLIQFYMPLIFVNQVGMSATAVGVGVGSGSLAGVAGHFLGGYLADSPQWGRKRTLLLSVTLSVLVTIVLAFTQTFPVLVLANLLMGLSAGCYWTAADATVMDLTVPEQRHTAFAILGLADSLGGGLGVLGGGLLLPLMAQAQTIFLCSAPLFLEFLGLVQVAMVETRQECPEHGDTLRGFAVALQDRSLRLFMLVNVLFTTYVALVGSILPLYFTRVVSTPSSPSVTGAGPSFLSVANVFTWCYIGLGALLQLPIAQLLSHLLKVQVLMMAMLLWGVGFFLVWVTGIGASLQLGWMIAALSVVAIATIIHKPFMPAMVAELAPASLRGVYIAISYQCWSVGYFVGPILGGWAIDQPGAITDSFWMTVCLSTIGGLILLQLLAQRRQVSLQSDAVDVASSQP